MRPWPLLALACALILHGPAAARAYTVDDLLGLEQLGPVQLAPGERWAVIQTFAPWDQAARYDLDWWSTYGLGRLGRVDLQDGEVSPLLFHAPGSGYVAGPFSPSGAKMAIYRLTGHNWELGVVTVATGETRWLGLSPELPMWGRSVAWRTDDELVIIAQPDEPVGHLLGYGWQAQARLRNAWAEAAAGRLAVNVVGSGRYRDLRAKAPPKRLVTTRISNGVVRDLARGEFIDLEISPDGRKVAVIANGEDIQDIQGLATTGTLGRRRSLILADFESSAISTPCAECDFTPRLLSWSATGERLLVHSRARDPAKAGYRIVDARSGKASAVALPGLIAAQSKARNNGDLAVGGWVGDTPVIYARPAGSSPSRVDWYALESGGPRKLTGALNAPSERLKAIDATGLIVVDGQSVWRVPLHGQARRLAQRADDLVRKESASQSERLADTPPPLSGLVVRATDRVRPFLVKGSSVSIRPGETPLVMTSDGGLAVLAKTDRRGVERLMLRSRTDGDRALTTLNSRLTEVDPAEVRPIHHLGPDGRMLTSWLYLPPKREPDVRVPLVVIPYPGDTSDEAPKHHTPGVLALYSSAQVLVGRGYAVLVPGLPYAVGREPMDGLAVQVLAAVDAAIAQAPVDPKRVAVWGHSYGGYAALAIATQSPRFKAVIASAAPSDLVSFYGKLSPYSYAVPEAGLPIHSTAGWSETGQGRMGVPPWKALDRYRRNSPITFADQITAPVMLIHGDMDQDVGQAQEMFTWLYRQNKDAVLLIYRGESHVILSPGNVRDQYARVFEFLAQNIGAGAR
ncbi:MAG: prolyl oligopeptidase family serine peptidase [Pseudomonadota bacterium]